jgi:D-lyxose ketol-isomerase
MLTKKKVEEAQRRAARMMMDAGIVITPAERRQIEICDYGLGDFERIGTAIVVYVNTKRCCAKELILFPGQMCPEHLHPVIGDYPGKEETFRCRWGEMVLCVPGRATPRPKAKLPPGREAMFTVRHEIVLRPGDQYTLRERTKHWFQAGPRGVIVSEFSTRSIDKGDIFTDPAIVRT